MTRPDGDGRRGLQEELALRHLDARSFVRREAVLMPLTALFALGLSSLMDLTAGEEVALSSNAVFAVAFAVFLTGLRAAVLLWARRLARVAVTAGVATNSPLRRRAKTWPAAEPLGKVERAAGVRDLRRFAVVAGVVGVVLGGVYAWTHPVPGVVESVLGLGAMGGVVFAVVALAEAFVVDRRGRR